MTEDTIKNDEKTAEDYLDPETKKFKKDNPGGGRPLGTKNFDTIFREAIEKLAKDDPEFVKVVGKSVDDVDRKLVRRAIIEAAAGNYAFYRDNFDRRFGKAIETIAHEGDITIKVDLYEK